MPTVRFSKPKEVLKAKASEQGLNARNRVALRGNRPFVPYESAAPPAPFGKEVLASVSRKRAATAPPPSSSARPPKRGKSAKLSAAPAAPKPKAKRVGGGAVSAPRRAPAAAPRPRQAIVQRAPLLVRQGARGSGSDLSDEDDDSLGDADSLGSGSSLSSGSDLSGSSFDEDGSLVSGSLDGSSDFSDDDDDSDVASAPARRPGPAARLAPGRQVGRQVGGGPAPGSAAEEIEKADLLMRFHTLRGRGVRMAKTFTMKSSLQEMRLEAGRIEHEEQLGRAVKSSKRWLMVVTSVLTKVTNRYGPAFLRGALDGFDKHLQASMTTLEPILERVSEEYGGVLTAFTGGDPLKEMLLELGVMLVSFVVFKWNSGGVEGSSTAPGSAAAASSSAELTSEEVRSKYPHVIQEAVRREMAERRREDEARAREQQERIRAAMYSEHMAQQQQQQQQAQAQQHASDFAAWLQQQQQAQQHAGPMQMDPEAAPVEGAAQDLLHAGDAMLLATEARNTFVAEPGARDAPGAGGDAAVFMGMQELMGAVPAHVAEDPARLAQGREPPAAQLVATPGGVAGASVAEVPTSDEDEDDWDAPVATRSGPPASRAAPPSKRSGASVQGTTTPSPSGGVVLSVA